MNPEVSESRHVFQIINKHLAEPDGCKHSLREVMKEALEDELKIKAVGLAAQQQHQRTDDAIIQRTSPNDYRDRIFKTR